MTATKLSNATAREYFLHANDEDQDGGRACFFSENGDDDGWGFWVNAAGNVTTDRISSNGEMPSSRVVEACVRAAVKYLAK